MKKKTDAIASAKERAEEKLHKIPLRITDTTLRDAHQSLWATRMRTDDILRIIDVIDNAGYYSLEVWGGATFDVCLRFLRENPWERLRMVKARAKKTPLQMLLRGQNLVGYRNYADDVVDRFVSLACENGIDIFRVFDALNDTRNLEAAVRAIKKHGGHAQGTLSYTISPFHTIEKFAEYAKEQVAIGIDSLCVKDMAGILSPIQAERLISALVASVDVPIQLHCHYSSGMATATYVEGVRTGAGAIDCAISPVAGFSSQPPVETLAFIFSETKYSADLDFDALEKIAKYFLDLTPKRRQSREAMPVIDPNVLIHQIPGGMISNFRSQLAQQKALDKLPLALEEVSKVRHDLGYPPLVTPTSQIVGTQAVMNVLSGERYKIVPNEVKNYVKGMYGRSPAPIDREFIRKILGDEKPITHRPADDLKPMLPTATDGLDPKFIEHEEDIISFCLLPEPALEYFKWRSLPPEQRGPTPAELEVEKMRAELGAPAQPAKTAESKQIQDADQILQEPDYAGVSQLLNAARGVCFEELTITKGSFTLTVRSSGAVSTGGAPAAPAAAPAAPAVSPKPAEEKKPAQKGAYARTINAPLVGAFYTTGGPGKPAFVKPGDTVKAGATVCIVEAMKLFNEIKAPADCTIVEILVKDGATVEKGQPLIGIS